MPLPPSADLLVRLYPTVHGRLTTEEQYSPQVWDGAHTPEKRSTFRICACQGRKGHSRSVTEAGAWLSNSTRLGRDRTPCPVGGKRCPEDTANGNEIPSLESPSVVPAHGRSSENVRFLPGKPHVFEVAWCGQGCLCLCWDPPGPHSAARQLLWGLRAAQHPLQARIPQCPHLQAGTPPC